MPSDPYVPLIVVGLVVIIVFLAGRARSEEVSDSPEEPPTGAEMIEHLQRTLGVAIVVESMESVETSEAPDTISIQATLMSGTHSTKVTVAGPTESEAWAALASRNRLAQFRLPAHPDVVGHWLTVPSTGMSGAEVLRVLDALEGAGITAGISGGWGVDALLRRETRPHGDVDLGVGAEDVDRAIAALKPLGYAVTVDERPARVVLQSGVGQVDLHPIVWDPSGAGVQTGLAGEVFEYPPGSLDAAGLIAGRTVRCATPDLQLAFHSHYEPRDHDRRDMAALADEFGVSLPPSDID